MNSKLVGNFHHCDCSVPFYAPLLCRYPIFLQYISAADVNVLEDEFESLQYQLLKQSHTPDIWQAALVIDDN